MGGGGHTYTLAVSKQSVRYKKYFMIFKVGISLSFVLFHVTIFVFISALFCFFKRESTRGVGVGRRGKEKRS